MAHTTIVMQNPNTGSMREVPIGLSWTGFFFTWIMPLFRKDFKWAGIFFLISLFGNIIFIGTGLIVGLVMLFVYNKIYLKECIESGYKFKTVIKGFRTVEDIEAAENVKIPRQA